MGRDRFFFYFYYLFKALNESLWYRMLIQDIIETSRRDCVNYKAFSWLHWARFALGLLSV